VNGGGDPYPFPNRTVRRAVEPFGAFSPADWYGKPAPAYDWLVDGCLLRGTVGMLSGDGGIGKSLLMQQLLTAASIGRNWLGLATAPCKGFGFFCEDDKDELHRRQERINEHYDCEHPDVDTLYVSRVGMENVLMEFDRRTDRMTPTPLWDQLQTAVLDFGAQLVLIDTIADAYGGNEIVRNQVRRFITELRRLAVRIQGAVIVTAHPSLTGMSSGTGLSGSTAWHNSVRSRMYLTKPRKADGGGDDEEEGMNERILKTMKNNQGPGAGKVPLLWQDGVFVRDDRNSSSNWIDRLDLDLRLVELLRQLVTNGSMVQAAYEYRGGFVNVARTYPEFRLCSQAAIIGAQERLLASGKIVRVELGSPAKRRKYLRPEELRYPGEES
jgi:RecA-family ATPase